MTEKKDMEFTNHLVAFVDVLGFKNIIVGIKGNREKQNIFLAKYLQNARGKALEIMGTKAGSGIDLKIQIFSDTFFFSIPCEETQLTDRLAHLTVAVGNLQAYLASINIWTRGAISYGELIRDEGNVVGPALIDAYLMEENDADVPRVILDPRLIKYFGRRDDLLKGVNNVNFENWRGRKIFAKNYLISRDFISDFDDLMFVDYFNGFFSQPYIDRNAIFSALENLKKNIYGSPEVYRKYVWVYRYFNVKKMILGEFQEKSNGFLEDDSLLLRNHNSIFNF